MHGGGLIEENHSSVAVAAALLPTPAREVAPQEIGVAGDVEEVLSRRSEPRRQLLQPAGYQEAQLPAPQVGALQHPAARLPGQ